MRESTLKRFLRLPHFEEHLELHRVDCLSSNGQLDTHHFIQEKRTELSHEELKPPPLITGKDLIDAGYGPGPTFSKMLAAAEDAQLEGTITTREEALELIRRLFGEPATPACS